MTIQEQIKVHPDFYPHPNHEVWVRNKKLKAKSALFMPVSQYVRYYINLEIAKSGKKYKAKQLKRVSKLLVVPFYTSNCK